MRKVRVSGYIREDYLTILKNYLNDTTVGGTISPHVEKAMVEYIDKEIIKKRGKRT